MIGTVAIVGAGFSGTLQALNLLRHDGPATVLIERADEPGRGIAFGAADPSHLLNVRASNMSAFPDAPDHFLQWLARTGRTEAAHAFVPRLVYGDYLREMLLAARDGAPGRLTIVKGDVVDLTEDRSVRLRLADGCRINADAAVLAVGNLPPHDPPGLEASELSPAVYQRDPWTRSPGLDLTGRDTVLLLGTGLTMVDVALALEGRGFRGRIIALSRRGLLPRAHEAAHGPWQWLDERPPCGASHLVRAVRGRARSIGWRNAVDELRPFTQTIWAAASDAERSRFLRHLRPWWDVHRHRLAPRVANRLASMRVDGRLTVVAGKTLRFAERDDGVEVTWRPRATDRVERMAVRRVVNCTGPLGDLHRTREPLLRAMLDRGAIRADPARLGIEVDRATAIVDAAGRSSSRLFAIGPMTRGAFWEIVAVPDIRSQAWTLARRLSNARWVDSESL